MRSPFWHVRLVQSKVTRRIWWFVWSVAVAWALYLVIHPSTPGRDPVRLTEAKVKSGPFMVPQYLEGEEYLKFSADHLLEEAPFMIKTGEDDTTRLELTARIATVKQPDQNLVPLPFTALMVVFVLIAGGAGLACFVWLVALSQFPESRNWKTVWRLSIGGVFIGAVLLGTKQQERLIIDNATDTPCRVTVQGATFELGRRSHVIVRTVRGSHHVRAIAPDGRRLFEGDLDVSSQPLGDDKWRLLNLDGVNAYALDSHRYRALRMR